MMTCRLLFDGVGLHPPGRRSTAACPDLLMVVEAAALLPSEDAPDVGGPLSGLDRELRRRGMELSEPERVALAEAYLFGRDGIADLIRRGDTFNDAYTVVLDHGEEWSRKRILDLLGAERDAAWAEAKRLKAALGAEREASG